MRCAGIIFIVCVLSLPGYMQENGSRKFWSLNSANGAINAGSSYRNLSGITNDIYNYQKTTGFFGGIKLGTGSSIYHPDFINIDLGLEYNPESVSDLYLVVPDQAEVRTMKKLDLIVSVFRQKQVNLSGFFNISDNFINRENLSNVRSGNKSYGFNLTLGNKILPLQAGYTERKWNESELATGRTFIMNQSDFTARINRSFTAYDRTSIAWFRNRYQRQDFNLARTQSVAHNIDFTNTIYFDSRQKITLSSCLNGIEQRGDYAFRRIQVNETFMLPLVKNLDFRSGYHYLNFSVHNQNTVQNSFDASLNHRLYQSLTSGIRGEYNRISHTFYHDQNLKGGIDLTYNKKLFLNGRLTLSYSLLLQRQKHESEPVPVYIHHEEHILWDGRMELLGKDNINVSSVVVKDITGTLFYQQDFDYFLIPRDNFIEIQRVPGGRLPNGATIYVDYQYFQPGNYSYDADYQNFGANVSLWGRLTEFYFKISRQDYFNCQTNDYLTLNFFDRQIFGIQSEAGVFSGGAEYENYHSSIIPYKLYSAFFAVRGSIRGKYPYSLNGRYRRYDMLSLSPDQTYLDITGNFSFPFSGRTGIMLEAAYRKQIGQGLDLDFLTARAEFTSNIRQTMIKLGLQVYRRDYLHETTDFFSGFIQIIRTFNWTRK